MNNNTKNKTSVNIKHIFSQGWKHRKKLTIKNVCIKYKEKYSARVEKDGKIRKKAI